MEISVLAAAISGEIILLPIAVITLVVYGDVVGRIAREGGKARKEGLGAADTLAGSLLILLFLKGIVEGFKSPPKPMHGEEIIRGTMVFMMIVAFLASFMHFRGIKLGEQFGVRKVALWKVPLIAAGLLLAAYPLIGVASLITQKLLGTEAQPQELVKYFQNAAEKSQYSAIIATMVMAVIFAPMVEEFIFRGYIYGVIKRHGGITLGVIFNAALFAAIHLNVASLPSLFLLAVCFTLAYEFTGSILVNMCMHALFNFANLCLLFFSARHSS